jgi:hypothetical protein
VAVVLVACDSAGPGPVVSAPSTAPLSGVLEVCATPWKLEVIGGGAQVVLVCPRDVRRASLDESSAFRQALPPALDPAHDRVCACAARLHPPPFVDLVFTAHPDEGRVTVTANGDEENDAQLAPPFIACVGTVNATFDAVHSGVCPDGPASLVYPVRLDLEAPRPENPPGTSAEADGPRSGLSSR